MLSSSEALVLFGFLLSIPWLLGAAYFLDTLFLAGAGPISCFITEEERTQATRRERFVILGTPYTCKLHLLSM